MAEMLSNHPFESTNRQMVNFLLLVIQIDNTELRLPQTSLQLATHEPCCYSPTANTIASVKQRSMLKNHKTSHSIATLLLARHSAWTFNGTLHTGTDSASDWREQWLLTKMKTTHYVSQYRRRCGGPWRQGKNKQANEQRWFVDWRPCIG